MKRKPVKVYITQRPTGTWEWWGFIGRVRLEPVRSWRTKENAKESARRWFRRHNIPFEIVEE